MIRGIQLVLTCLAVLVIQAGHVNAGLILSDNFDPDVDPGTFSATSNAAAIGNGQPGFLSGNALHFDGNGARFATTFGLDVSGGGMISFDFRGGNEGVDGDTFWENSDEKEEWADLAYSIDGGTTFVDFQALDTEVNEGENPTVWKHLDVPIPAAAQTSNTVFRWQQRGHSGLGFDHWAIDNLAITTEDNGGNPAIVPEPSSFALFGFFACVGGIGAMCRRRRGQKKETDANA